MDNCFDVILNIRNIDCYSFNNFDVFNSFIAGEEGSNLSIMHLNIRSYHKNFDELFVIKNSLKNNVDVIVLSESWLCSDNLMVEMEGFNVFQNQNKQNKSYGVLVYINKLLPASCSEFLIGGATCLKVKFQVWSRQSYGLLAIYNSSANGLDMFTQGLKRFYEKIDSVKSLHTKIVFWKVV